MNRKQSTLQEVDSGRSEPSGGILKNPLPFARPDIGPEEIEAVTRILESGWLTSGPETELFEEEFARAVDARHTLAVNSATAALHLSLVACDIGPRDAVVVPAITFTATAEIIGYCGALPLILDVNRESYLLDPDDVRDYFERTCIHRQGALLHRPSGRRVRAIIPVHIGGRPCELKEFQKIGQDFGVHIIEDAAHAFPALYNDRPIGSISEFTAFSFYATKNLTTGEGGMLTLSNKKTAERLRRIRLHGIRGQTYGRSRWHYDVVDQGYKYNMTDICAAMGRVQLRRSQAMLEKRRALENFYRRRLSDLKGIRLTPRSVHQDSCHLFTLEIEPEAGISRDRFVEEMYARGIAVSLHFIPLYRHTYYKKKFGLRIQDYGRAEEIYRRLVSLPIYSAMDETDAADVVRTIHDIISDPTHPSGR